MLLGLLDPFDVRGDLLDVLCRILDDMVVGWLDTLFFTVLNLVDDVMHTMFQLIRLFIAKAMHFSGDRLVHDLVELV